MSKYIEEVMREIGRQDAAVHASSDIVINYGTLKRIIQSALQKQIEMIEWEIESRRRTITLTQILDILNQYK